MDSQLKIVIFGQALGSSRSHGHPTLWRGLCRALAARGHRISFFEKAAPTRAAHRDLTELGGAELVLYPEWRDILPLATRTLAGADAAIVSSGCPDVVAAAQLVLASPSAVRVFYALDTPATLEDFAPGLGEFDLVLSSTGGRALEALKSTLGAREVAPLYRSVDPLVHRPRRPLASFRSDLSYLAAFAPDRQPALEELFVDVARRQPERKFILAGAQYPPLFPWQPNIFHFDQLPPSKHPALYASSRLTLSVTGGPTAKLGFCPSGQLFEAAACGVPLVSDRWEGIEQFFTPGSEILLASTSEDTLNAMQLSDRELRQMAERARERTLQQHTAERRAEELERILGAAASASHLAPRRSARRRHTWGIIPAAGAGGRIQPLAFSKELLPVGSRMEGGLERPAAVSEFLVDRMLRGGATRIGFVIAPGKSDIVEYFGGAYGGAALCYCVQPSPTGLCDALFRSIPFIHDEDDVLIGLPDTIWFPLDGFGLLDSDTLSFLLFPVKTPERFDAVILDPNGRVLELQVQRPDAGSNWIWGAFRMPGRIFHELHALWLEREECDESFGTLANAWIDRGGQATGVRGGESYVDAGTLPGYREALRVLRARHCDAEPVADLR